MENTSETGHTVHARLHLGTHLWVVLVFETGFHYLAQAALHLVILLPRVTDL